MRRILVTVLMYIISDVWGHTVFFHVFHYYMTNFCIFSPHYFTSSIVLFWFESPSLHFTRGVTPSQTKSQEATTSLLVEWPK